LSAQFPSEGLPYRYGRARRHASNSDTSRSPQIFCSRVDAMLPSQAKVYRSQGSSGLNRFIRTGAFPGNCQWQYIVFYFCIRRTGRQLVSRQGETFAWFVRVFCAHQVPYFIISLESIILRSIGSWLPSFLHNRFCSSIHHTWYLSVFGPIGAAIGLVSALIVSVLLWVQISRFDSTLAT